MNFSKHQAVVAAFGQHFVKTGIFKHKFHQYLVEAFEQRQIGDYEPMEGITKEPRRKILTGQKNFWLQRECILKKPNNTANK